MTYLVFFPPGPQVGYHCMYCTNSIDKHAINKKNRCNTKREMLQVAIIYILSLRPVSVYLQICCVVLLFSPYLPILDVWIEQP